eukprot:2290964-Pyramimonas_sp.AAC.1
MCAGAFLQCHGQCSSVAGCSKVAAHQDIEDPTIDATERWRRVGNVFADARGKNGPSSSPFRRWLASGC